jgi:RNA polymerase sigma factor (TIGR02999 family)
MRGGTVKVESGEITSALRRWSAGEREAAEQVLPLVYGELRKIAARQLRRERRALTIQPTDVVHEAYLRLRDALGVSWNDRVQFFAFAAHVMRRVLVDRARDRNRLKRGGGVCTLALDPEVAPAPERCPDVLAVDDALRSLERVDSRKAAIVEMRFFAGFTLAEAAGFLGISVETAGREWRRAKAWLRAELEEAPGV